MRDRKMASLPDRQKKKRKTYFRSAAWATVQKQLTSTKRRGAKKNYVSMLDFHPLVLLHAVRAILFADRETYTRHYRLVASRYLYTGGTTIGKKRS